MSDDVENSCKTRHSVPPSSVRDRVDCNGRRVVGDLSFRLANRAAMAKLSADQAEAACAIDRLGTLANPDLVVDLLQAPLDRPFSQAEALTHVAVA